MSEELSCKICRAQTSAELMPVRPNLRNLRNERFHVWRCGACQSLHCYETVDLDRYYKEYQFTDDSLNWMARILLRAHLRRLERAGITREQSILDFGCGNGKFVRYLRERGYERARGYDAYSPEFRDPAPLAERYDVVFLQDVLEHAEDPWEMLARVDGLLADGGVVLIGTPNASGIDPARVERFVHSLHVPFHRHIFSEPALEAAGEKLGWKLIRFYSDSYNTPFPFLNYRYALFYMQSWDNTPESLGQVKPNARLIFHPLAHFYAFFGALVPPKSDCQILFRKPPA